MGRQTHLEITVFVWKSVIVIVSLVSDIKYWVYSKTRKVDLIFQLEFWQK